MYAANDRGKIFCFNVVTGQSVMGHSSDSHSSSVHSLKFVSGSNILVSCDSSGVLCTWGKFYDRFKLFLYFALTN